MIDKKEFWSTIRECASDELEQSTRTSTDIAASQAKIEKMLACTAVDAVALEEEWNYLCQQRSMMAYIQGLQDGSKLINMLLSGEAVNHMLMIFGEKAGSNETMWMKFMGGGDVCNGSK